MRIVGGSLRGRRLAVPGSDRIRPTTDRVRESLFNILQHSYADHLKGSHVLDAFAGTGALGIEALSRGAASVTFVEKNAEAADLIKANVETLGIAGSTKLVRQDVTTLRHRQFGNPCELIFADPPYGFNLAPLALTALDNGGWLAPEALAVVEEKRHALPEHIDGFDCLEIRSFGSTDIGFYRKA